MGQRDLCLLFVGGLILGGAAPVAAAVPLALPGLPGFTAEGEALHFDADSLYEHIDGDAFSYLSYGFEELVVQEFKGPEGRALTVEVYRHRDANNGFGIYSYERPPRGTFFRLGGEGYLEEEALNFFKGAYYVKLQGAGLDGDAEKVLRDAAATIADSLPGEEGYPPAVRAFPQQGLREDSVRYVGESLLGHSFLRSGFVADYGTGDGGYRAFVVKASDAAEAGRMLEQYLALLDKKGEPYANDAGVFRFHDPYNKSEGSLNVKRSGVWLFGVFGDDKAVADGWLRAIEANLAGSGE